jgi:glycosyltransferase involved in cell wall biosynthesis
MIRKSKHDAGKEWIAVFTHDATRTGAPVIAWNLIEKLREKYNVAVVSFGGGELTPAFERVASAYCRVASQSDDSLSELASEIAALRPVYALVNSIVSTRAVSALKRHGIRTLSLVHEFAFMPDYAGYIALAKESDAIIFPAEIIKQDFIKSAKTEDCPNFHVLPQGLTLSPDGPCLSERKRLTDRLKSLAGDYFVVLGVGYACWRKGTELFIETAAHLKRMHPLLRFKFVWIGYAGDESNRAFWERQIEISGLGNTVFFLGPFQDTAPVYEMADVLFLSSRFDPFPCVAVEAACAGVPIICFENATGFTEFLRQSDLLSRGIVDYADVAGAAGALFNLASDAHALTSAANETLSLSKSFDMRKYAEKIDRVARA